MDNQKKLPNWFEAKVYESGDLVFQARHKNMLNWTLFQALCTI